MDEYTFYIAIYGAVLSTISIVLNFTKEFRDRGNLRVNIYVGSFVSESRDSPLVANEQFNHLCVNITNVGRRPVNVEYFTARSDRKWFGRDHFLWFKPTNLPRMLNEGESVLEHYPLTLDFRDDLLKALSLGAIDSRINFYAISLWELRKLKKRLKTAIIKPDSFSGQ